MGVIVSIFESVFPNIPNLSYLIVQIFRGIEAILYAIVNGTVTIIMAVVNSIVTLFDVLITFLTYTFSKGKLLTGSCGYRG